MKLAATKAALIFALLMSIPDSQASMMRCGNYVIQDGGRHGPTMYEVLKKCGEPDYRHGSIWIYEFPNRNWELKFGSNGILKTATLLR
ncbi:MAG: DUF2845 domain-containing protein [Pseudomonadota bacterium]